jgi:glycine betaine/proline transport system ATP-binding protein
VAEVEFRKVDVVFGPDPGRALKLLDEGATREAILEQTGHVLGVADATIAIEPGEICVLMGLSGSGKSTLLRCVNRLNKATRGAVLVDDANGPVDVATCDPATLRRLRTRRIAMVFQQLRCCPGARCRRTSVLAWSCAAWPGPSATAWSRTS